MKKIPLLFHLFLGATTLLPILAENTWAAPTAFPVGGWNLAGVKNPTNSTLISDSIDNRMVWVLPPTAGTIAPGALRGGNANLGYCANISSLQLSARAVEKEISENILAVAKTADEMKTKKSRYDTLNSDAEKLKNSNPLIGQLQVMEDQVAALNTHLQNSSTLLDTCGEQSSLRCTELLADMRETRKQRTNLQAKLIQFRAQLAGDLRNYSRAKGLADAAKEEYLSAAEYLKRTRKDLNDGRDELMGMYRQYARLEAGYSHIEYKSGWDENVKTLGQLNPNFTFRQIQTQEAKINVLMVPNEKSEDAYLGSFPSILGYTVNGQSYSPYGDATGQQTLAAFPERMGADLRLSLMGGCPMLHPESFDIPKDNTGTPTFTIASSYNYPLEYRTHVTFTYNLSKFYDLMKKSGSSGGFFSTSSWSETSEQRDDHDSFYADWQESDPANQTSPEDKRKIEKEIKAELTERVLKQMATPVADGRVGIGNAPPAPTSGAIVFAQGLSATCGSFNFYCSAGSWLLNGLGSVFGSNEVENHFRSKYNASSTEKWSQQTVRYKPGMTVFGEAKSAN